MSKPTHSDLREPVRLCGASISYFTGKLENYFKIKGIPYKYQPMTRHARAAVKAGTGSTQMPAIQLADGTWMSDSTPIIQWFEAASVDRPVIPADPTQRFFSLLLEDYADEWLWRPAMHYRWHYDVGARFASASIADEVGSDVAVPNAILRRVIVRRQRRGYTTGDGITADQVPGVEAIFRRTLGQLDAIFASRPFLLGGSPSLADIGFSGPFFRHFALDPVPAEIIRQEAPSVYAWVGRLWNARLDHNAPELVDGVPDDWGPILDEIGASYLPYLCANTDAVRAGRKTFDCEVGGVRYQGARWSPYRVWCLQRLREHFLALPESEQTDVRTRLERHNCWEPMWRDRELPIDEDFCARLPFHADAKMIDVYD